MTTKTIQLTGRILVYVKNAPKRFWGVFSLTGVIASPPSTNTLTDDVMRQNLSFGLLSQHIVSGNVYRTGRL
ncbi:hypothetical protein RFF01_006237, partial [Klebsiella variicola]